MAYISDNIIAITDYNNQSISVWLIDSGATFLEQLLPFREAISDTTLYIHEPAEKLT